MKPNRMDIVSAVKAELEGRGVNLSGPCGAWEITRRVAWELRADGAGTLTKMIGNQCRGHAVDILAFRDGTIVDVLVDAGGTNTPAWQDAGVFEITRWEAPVMFVDSVPPPGAPPLPVPAPPPPEPLFERDPVDELLASLERIESGMTQVVVAMAGLSLKLDILQVNGVRLRL